MPGRRIRVVISVQLPLGHSQYSNENRLIPRRSALLTVVDPRNTAWLLPAVWRDARRRGLSRRAALKQVNAATQACAVLCDGLVLGCSAEPEGAVAAVEADIAGRDRSG